MNCEMNILHKSSSLSDENSMIHNRNTIRSYFIGDSIVSCSVATSYQLC